MSVEHRQAEAVVLGGTPTCRKFDYVLVCSKGVLLEASNRASAVAVDVDLKVDRTRPTLC